VGLTVIVKLDAAARREGFDLILVEGDAEIQRVFELCGLVEALPFVAAPDDGETGARGREHAVIATDLGGTVSRWNAAAEELYGWSARDVLGRAITDLTVGPHDQELAQAIMRSVRDARSWEGEFEVRAKDGTQFLAHVRDTLIEDDDGRPIGLVGVSIDAGSAPVAAA
jgi:PAS domain S-box-containing protein